MLNKSKIIKTKVIYSCKNMYEPFLDNIEMVYDLIVMTREQFLKEYFYISDLQYNITRDLFYSDKKNNLIKLYNQIETSNIKQKENKLKKLKKLLDK